MSRWVKNAIGLAFVVILLVIAWRFLQGDAGEVTILESGVKVSPRAQEIAKAQPPPPTTQGLKICRRPAHGIEEFGKTEKWVADSGWRTGGSSPSEFCEAQKHQREAAHLGRTVMLLATAEDHKTEYDPFKRDYYRYSCFFEDRWDPIYRMAASSECSAG